MTNRLPQRLEAERHRLFAIAYRMLGTATDAEDVLQDAYLRLSSVGDCESPEAMLTTIVVRLCLDQLKSARMQRLSYVGPWLPELIGTDEGTFDRDSLAPALLVLLEALSPAERAVWVLHEVFDYSHEEIGRTLDKPAGTSRQLLLRARAHVGERRERHRPTPAERDRLLGTFFHVCATGDVDAMRALLAADVRATTDGNGIPGAARNIVTGADHVARFLVGIARRVPENATFELRELNGANALVMRSPEGIHTAMVLELAASGALVDVAIVRSPEKLRALR